MAIVVKDNQWGQMKNGKFMPLTNFVFDLQYCVTTEQPGNSGYLVSLTRNSDGKTGPASFRFQDTASNKDFIRAINDSFDGKRLFSSLKVEQICTVLREMDRELGDQDCKVLVTTAGRQTDGSIFISPTCVVNKEGEKVDWKDSRFIWVPEWEGAPDVSIGRRLTEPFSTGPLRKFIRELHSTFDNNAAPALLALITLTAASDYTGIIDLLGHFNTPLLTGPPMTGKTLAATCASFVFGCSRDQIVSRSTLAYLTESFSSSTLPFVWDDPSKPTDVMQIAVDLGNGALRGRASGQTLKPRTACLITANFDLTDELRYSSRVTNIPFATLTKRKHPGEGQRLEKLAKEASSALPILLNLGSSLRLDEVKVELNGLEANGRDLRQLEGIAVVLATARKILKLVELPYMEEVMEFLAPPEMPDIEDDEGIMLGWLREIGATFATNEMPMRVQGKVLFVRSSAILELVDRLTMKQVMKKLGADMSRVVRIPASAKSAVRCIGVSLSQHNKIAEYVDDLLPAAPVRRGTETAATPATPPRAPATPPRKSGSPLREPAADRYKSAATPATPPQAPAPTPRKRGSPLRAPAADRYKSAATPATPPQAPAPTPRKRGSHLREPAADQYKSAATPATPPRAPAPTPRKRGSHLRAPAADQYKSAATPATPPRAPDTPPRESGSPLREPAADQYKSAATPATPPRAPATPPRESGSPLREPAADRYKSAATPATPPQAPAPTPRERGSPLRAPAADQYKSASSLDTKLSLPPKPHSTKFIPNLPVPRRASRKASTKEKPKLWCSCRTTSTRGKMIGCDSDNCKIEWYHMKCLKMKKAPLAEWICPNCNIK